MEIIKNAKTELKVIITLIAILLFSVFMYFSAANIGYKDGYNVPMSELI